jgi:hypothetical protein
MREGEARPGRPACAHSWYKNDVIGLDEKGCNIYKSELYCWGFEVVKDDKGETQIRMVPLKPCDDCDDRYVADIGP